MYSYIDFSPAELNKEITSLRKGIQDVEKV